MNLLDIVFFIKNICNVIIKYLKTNCFFLPIYRKQETRYELHSYQVKMNEKLYQEVLNLFDPLRVTSTGLFFFFSIILLFHWPINIHFLILSFFFLQKKFNYIIILYFYLNKKFLFSFCLIFLNKKIFDFILNYFNYLVQIIQLKNSNIRKIYLILLIPSSNLYFYSRFI